MLSKTLYEKKINEYLKNQKKKFENISDEVTLNTCKVIVFWITFLIELFWIIFYAVLGTKIGTIGFIIMSVLQIFTCLFNLKELFGMDVLSQNIEDYKFHRLFFLFNLVLDYIYYPSAIYFLLK
jgi:hypothetical protein